MYSMHIPCRKTAAFYSWVSIDIFWLLDWSQNEYYLHFVPRLRWFLTYYQSSLIVAPYIDCTWRQLSPHDKWSWLTSSIYLFCMWRKFDWSEIEFTLIRSFISCGCNFIYVTLQALEVPCIFLAWAEKLIEGIRVCLVKLSYKLA
jgi:hypothetical protein